MNKVLIFTSLISVCSFSGLYASEMPRMPQPYAVCPEPPRSKPSRLDTTLQWISLVDLDEEDRKLEESINRRREELEERQKQEREDERQKQHKARLAILSARTVEHKDAVRDTSKYFQTLEEQERAKGSIYTGIPEIADWPSWIGGDVTALEDVQEFNKWFYQWNGDEGIAEGLDTWGLQHPYFEFQIREQLYLLRNHRMIAITNTTQYDKQIGRREKARQEKLRDEARAKARAEVDKLWPEKTDITQLEGVEEFDVWFNANKTNVEVLQTELPKYESRHPYFTWQIADQIYYLKEEPGRASSMESELYWQKQAIETQRRTEEFERTRKKGLAGFLNYFFGI